jgi:hypothetical protein
VGCNDCNLIIGPMAIKNEDTHIIIDTKREIIIGYNDNTKKETKNLYNKYIVSGNFFKLPIQEEIILTFPIDGELNFNYLYL